MNANSNDVRRAAGVRNLACEFALHFEVGAELTAAIIAERTDALAKQFSPGPLGEGASSVCMFRVGSERFALNVRAIEAVIKARPLGALPADNEKYLGTLFERGEIWIVYSLRALMGGASEAEFTTGHLLLLQGDGRRAAIFVDHVEEVTSISRAMFSGSSEDESAAEKPLVRGTAPDGRMLLDPDAIRSVLSRKQRSDS